MHGMNKNNAGLYQFRVMEYPGQKIIVPWKTISQFTDSSLIRKSGLPQMAYLGGYKAPLGKMLIVDVKKIGQRSMVATSLVAWESIRPAVSSIYTSADLDIFLQKLQYPWAKSRAPAPAQYSLNNLKLPATNNNLIFVLNANILKKDQVQYELIRNNKVIRPWHDNEYDNSFIWLKDFSPGQYLIRMRYTVQPQHVAEYNFDVEPFWYQSFWFRALVFCAVAATICFFLFVYLLIRQRSKTRQESSNKQKLQLELKTLYAQLNPHFVFNALSSIQGLINSHNLKGANEYLSDFALLMRKSLMNSNKEEMSLHQELQTMKTYLKLEQLRFGFHYSIHVDDDIDLSTTSLPALLWQPLLENAVKHGVATLQQNGRITIRFDKVDNTLLINITDNGKGMRSDESNGGFGLKLTRDRIKLLNELNSEQPITFAFNKLTSGTGLTLTFTNWFL